MTAQTRTVNKGRFEQGDKPQGSDYVDLIDSFISVADSTAQSISSDLIVSQAVVTNVSALSVYASAANFKSISFTSVAATSLNTAQSSAFFQSATSQVQLVKLMRMEVEGTSVAVLYTNVGSYF